MLTQYVNGQLSGKQLKEFERQLYEYIHTNNETSISIDEFSESIKHQIQSINTVEQKLDKNDFFFAIQLSRKDEKAIKKLYEKVYGKIKGHVSSNSGDEHDAKNVTREAILIFLNKKLEDIVSVTDIGKYVFGISKNIWFTELKKRGKEKKKENKYIESQEHSTQPHDMSEDIDTARERILYECLNQLNTNQKEFLIYYDIEQHTIKETALYFNKTEDVIKQYARRYRKYLENKLINHPEYNEYFN